MASLYQNEITAFLKGFIEAYKKNNTREEKSEFLNTLFSEIQSINKENGQEQELESFLKELEEEVTEITKEGNTQNEEKEFIEAFLAEARENLNNLEKEEKGNEPIVENSNEKQEAEWGYYTIPLGYDSFHKEIEELKLTANAPSLKEKYAREWIEVASKKSGLNMKFDGYAEDGETPIVYVTFKEGEQKLPREDFISILRENLPQEEEIFMWKETETIKESENELEVSKEQDTIKISALVEGEELNSTIISPLIEEIETLTIDKNNENKKEEQIKEEGKGIPLTNFGMWLNKAKERAKSGNLTKQEFKESFVAYFSKNANDIDSRLLIALLEKEPSRLNREHKELITEGMKALSLSQNRELGEDTKAYSKYRAGIPVEEKELDLCKIFADRLQESDLRVDKVIYKKMSEQIITRTIKTNRKEKVLQNKKENGMGM